MPNIPKDIPEIELFTKENGRKLAEHEFELEFDRCRMDGAWGVLSVDIECPYHDSREVLTALELDVDSAQAFIHLLEGWIAQTKQDEKGRDKELAEG